MDNISRRRSQLLAISRKPKKEPTMVELMRWLVGEFGFMAMLVMFSMGMVSLGSGIKMIGYSRQERVAYEARLLKVQESELALNDQVDVDSQESNDLVIGELNLAYTDKDNSQTLATQGLWLVAMSVMLFVAGVVVVLVG